MSVERKWTAEEIAKDDVSKKDIIAFLHGIVISYFDNSYWSNLFRTNQNCGESHV